MAWVPVKNVIDESVLVENLKSFIETNQTDAIAWANGGAGLVDFAAVYSTASGRIASLFPNLMFISSASAEQTPGALEAAFSTIIEGEITGPDADQLAIDARIYATAVKSMLKNITIAALTSGASVYCTGYIDTIETEFDILRGSKAATSFLQIFQIRVNYLLKASPEAS